MTKTAFSLLFLHKKVETLCKNSAAAPCGDLADPSAPLLKMNLIFVNGTMGVGKTSVCRELAKILPENVFLDGDTCLAATPFYNTEAHRALILKNIADLLNNFLQSGLFENVLFCWVMHEKEIVQDVLSRLHGEFTFRIFTLTCEKEELFARLRGDVSAGIRDGGIFSRSEERAAHYAGFPEKIKTDGKSAEEIAVELAARLGCGFSAKVYSDLPEEAKAIREGVFVREQGFCEEFDETDKKAEHVLLFYGQRPAGTCRLFEREGWHIGRVAVERAFRDMGCGKLLMRAAEERILERGGDCCTLYAQTRAQAFYEKCGYTAEGEPFSEENCPHVAMKKLLRPFARKSFSENQALKK